LTSWLVNHWVYVVVPLAVFIAAAALGLWTRLTVHRLIKQQWHDTGPIQKFVIDTLWHPFLHWFLLLGTYAAIQVSILSPIVKRLVGEGVASLFVLSLMWVAIKISERLIRFYLGKVEARQSVTSLAFNAVRATVALVGILTIFDIWGAPTEPIIIVLIASFLVIGLALRNNIDNLVAWLDIVYGEHIKVGHLIKLDSGEAGHVAQISLTKTIIKTVEGNLVIIPNSKLMANTIVNYGAAAAKSTANDVQTDLAAVAATSPVDSLTDREREVLRLIGRGATNREIAQELIISEHTVKSHLRSILNKLNIRNRQQAAVYAEREGLVADAEALRTHS
jgi:DNA-binding CsgD family transcriptional regulator